MVRFIHISDVHLGFEQYGSYERFKDFARAMNHAVEMAIEEHVDFMIIGGDLFNKKNIKAATLLQADRILTKARDAGIPVVACEGNHDSLSYGESWSWLDYLAKKDLLVLLGLPFDERKGSPQRDTEGANGNSELLNAWDPETREGTYTELTFGKQKIRIYGFGYLGATTRKRIEVLSEHIIRDDSINIGILHTGVEGIIANMHGTIPEHGLGPFKGKLDYLALGHIHKRFEIENWTFNPGSTENCSLEEVSPNNPHGSYLVDITPDPSDAGKSGNARVNAAFIDGSSWRRPFSVIPVDLTGSSTQEDVIERTMSKVAEVFEDAGRSVEPMPFTQDKRLPAPAAQEDPAPTRAAKQKTFGTLDAYVLESIPAQDNEIIVPESKPGLQGAEMPVETSLQPVVIVRLRGAMGNRDRIDTTEVHDKIRHIIHPSPLHLEVRDETSREGFVVEEDTMATRLEFERQVIMELLTTGEFGAHADQLHTLMWDFRDSLLSGSKDDLNSFDVRVRELANAITQDQKNEE